MPDISNQPVFPQTVRSAFRPSSTSAAGRTEPVQGGLTVLDYYAGQVLQGILSSGAYTPAALADAGVHKEIAEIVWELAMGVAANKPQ